MAAGSYSQTWRGRPLTSYAAIVQLIGNTTTTKGLQIRAELDDHTYPVKEKVTLEQMANVRLTPAEFHGEWNYTITPHE
jgi:hypothetical protein